MKNVTAIIVLSLFLFGVASICSGEGQGPECGTHFGGKCRTVCGSNERWKHGAFVDCKEEEKCCIIGKSTAKRLKQISGQITAIDRNEKSITLGGITIVTDDKMLATLKEGDSVKVDYYSKGVHRAIFILREVK
jgi:hypothetical protein